MSEHTAENDAGWTRNDRADHEAGHPSGYDCDGYAIMPPHEVCARVIPLGEDPS